NAVSGGPAPPGELPGGLSHYPINRRLYECRSRAEVLRMWEQLPVCSSANYMLSAPGDDGPLELFDLEVTPRATAVLEDGGAGFLAHPTRLPSPNSGPEEPARLSLPDSPARLERMTALLRHRAGSLDVKEMKRLLADHDGHPTSICRHDETGARPMVTIAG